MIQSHFADGLDHQEPRRVALEEVLQHFQALPFCIDVRVKKLVQVSCMGTAVGAAPPEVGTADLPCDG